MGQSNDNEKPEIILDKLKSLTIKDENNISLDKSFHTIKNIITDYKFYKDILKKNDDNEKKGISYNGKKKYSSTHEFSKYEILNIEGAYDKIVIQDINHTIERIKKWIKMVQYPYLKNHNNNNKDIFEETFQSIENDLSIIENKDKNNDNSKNNKKMILNKYIDKKIENGITEFSKNQKNKFVERLKKGPPDCFRWRSWCIINNLPLDRQNITYENYTNMVLEKENKDRIIRDIERTFSEKNIEKKELRKMEASLYKVLKAFWNLDKEIGY